MKSTVLASVMILPVLAGLNSLREPTVAPVHVVLPCVALSGAHSQIGEKSYLRITNENDWVKLWRKHKGDQSGGEYDFHHDPLGLPVVDFERFMVIALFEQGWDGFRADPLSESATEMTFCFRTHGHSTGFARPFPNKPEDCVGDDDDWGPEQKSYGFFFVPKSNKTIIIGKKSTETEVHEIFRISALK